MIYAERGSIPRRRIINYKKMNKIEFYTFNGEVWYRTDTDNKKLTEENSLVDDLISVLQEMYPQAYSALDKEYQKINDLRYKRWRMICRFVKCNFGEIDNVLDVSSNGKWVFECVRCPLRGECKCEGVICQPEFNTELSRREREVLRYVYNGTPVQDIAERVFLSPHTVKNHIRNAFTKLDVHSTPEFIVYANEHELYGDERIG